VDRGRRDLRCTRWVDPVQAAGKMGGAGAGEDE
jgi:hypothetical protein